MKRTIEETVAAVKNAPGSMYTREDVISLLEKLEGGSTSRKLDSEAISKLVSRICEVVRENANNLDNDAIDLSTAEFSLNYNEVCLDSVEFDTDNIGNTVVEGIEEIGRAHV